MSEEIKLIGIGALGLMNEWIPEHLEKQTLYPVRYLRVLDSSRKDERTNIARNRYAGHGAEIVSNYDDLISDGNFDGITLCLNKNSSVCKVYNQIIPRLRKLKKTAGKFIINFTTVTPECSKLESEICISNKMDFAAGMLTGGPRGAKLGEMLILYSGSEKLFRFLEDSFLKHVGKPRFVGKRAENSAIVKLTNQISVFLSLRTYAAAVAFDTAALRNYKFGGAEQSAHFDFLNAGAGGGRQWELALKPAVLEGIYNQGFLVKHAAWDAIYAAQMASTLKLSRSSIFLPLLDVAASFSYALKKDGQDCATQSIVRHFYSDEADAHDAFIRQINYRAQGLTDEQRISRVVASFPSSIAEEGKILLTMNDFPFNG